MGSLLSRVVFPTLVKITSTELSRISRVLSSGLLEILMRAWAATDGAVPAGVVEGLVCSAGSGFSAAVSAGLAFRRDASGVDLAAVDDHPWRLISQRAASSVVLSAADPTHDRIDVIAITDGEADGPSVAVSVWNELLRKFSGANHPQLRVNTPALAVFTGTPAASPAVPTIPGGYLALSRVLVPAGVADLSGATFTDARTLLRGPGRLWTDLVKRTGDTMSGALAILGSTAAHCFGVQMSGTPGRVMAFGQPGSTSAGLWVAGTSALNGPSAPELEVRGHTGSVSGTHASAGTVYAADGALHYSAKNYAGSAEYKVAKAATRRTELWQEGAVAGGRLDVGNVRVLDSDPAPASLASGDMGALFRSLVPWLAVAVPSGSSPTVTYSFNVESVALIGTGYYQITLKIPLPSADALCEAFGTDTSSDIALKAGISTRSTTELFVKVTDSTGTMVDGGFRLVGWALTAH